MKTPVEQHLSLSNMDWFTLRIGTVSGLQTDHYSLIVEVEKKRLAYHCYQHSLDTVPKTQNGNYFFWSSQRALHQANWTKDWNIFQLKSGILQILSLYYFKPLLINVLLNTFLESFHWLKQSLTRAIN